MYSDLNNWGEFNHVIHINFFFLDIWKKWCYVEDIFNWHFSIFLDIVKYGHHITNLIILC